MDYLHFSNLIVAYMDFLKNFILTNHKKQHQDRA